MHLPFLQALQATCHARASHPALIHHDRTITYGELDAHAQQGAAWLHALGVERGDRVVLCTADKLAFLLAHLAALYAGAVSLPLNPRFTREELRFYLSDSGARLALVGEEARAVLEALRPELPELRAVVSDAEMFSRGACAALQKSAAQAPRLNEISADDPCLIIYSSGTTGWPKGVVHTHGNLASSMLALQACWRFTPEDVVLNVLPLFHVHGLCFATQMTLLTGGCVILDEFEPQRTLARIRDCTVFMAVPTIYYRFLEQPNFRDMARTWSRPRLFTCGSAPIRAEVLPELQAILGMPVINRYGMSEAFVITSLPLDGPWPDGSVGRPLHGIEVRIVAPGTENVVAAGEVGTVQLRGPNLFRAYWGKPDATQAAFAGGWFDTGDLGFQDHAGFLTLVGRKNDLIITSGFNVYPQVVERIINECPGVRESAVLGVPDERKGERVVAFVVRADPTLDEARVQGFLRERLVDYQRPKQVSFVESLPRNTMGKVLRRELRAAMLLKPESI